MKSCRENLWNEIQLNGAIQTKTGTKTEEEKKEEEKRWTSSFGLCLRHQRQHPQHEKVSPRGANKAEIRPEEQSEKAESCWENLWNEIQLKGPYRQKQTQERNKKEWARPVVLC